MAIYPNGQYTPPTSYNTDPRKKWGLAGWGDTGQAAAAASSYVPPSPGAGMNAFTMARYGGGAGSAYAPYTGGGGNGSGWISDMFSKDGFGMAASGLNAVSNVANAFLGFKNYKLAKQSMKDQKAFADENMLMAKTAYRDNVNQFNFGQGERQAFVDATHADPSKSNIQFLPNYTLA